MEKLQKAIEKARADRQAGTSQTFLKGSAKPAGTRSRKTADLETDFSETPWGALGRMTLDANALLHKRVFLDTQNPSRAHFDLLRTRLRDEMRKHDARRVAILSPGPNAGKSTVVSNLALSFGSLRFMRTMVFDFDLRRPSLHMILNQAPTNNMASVIQGDIPFAEHMQCHDNNLAFGFNNSNVANSAELLQGDQIGTFLDGVQDSYDPDMMIFDLPPFLVSDDSVGFLRHIDGVILIVESEVTPKAQIDAVEQALSEKTKIFGVVLNKCHFPDKNDISGYEYGYY